MRKPSAAKTPHTPPINGFEIMEAYKTLRANLLFALATVNKKIIVVSGSEPDAGKSTTCSNLAVLMAQTGSSVLLIDADLRKPTLHRMFHVGKNEGLTKYLLRGGAWESSLTKEVSPHMDLLPSGPIPPNPSELLSSDRMAALLEQAAEKYDYVFIDTPPINVVTDGLVLSAHAAGTMLVVRQSRTTYEELREAVENIEKVNGNLLGVVINDFRHVAGERHRPAYYKRYAYGYAAASED